MFYINDPTMFETTSASMILMKNAFHLFIATGLFASPIPVSAQKPVVERPRILISTDIGGTDPDDNQSMAHFLMYCNEFDTEGLVSSPSYGSGNKKEILRMIDLYEKQLPQLKKHADGWADPDYLRSITKQGRAGAAPLEGFATATEGSEWIVECARRKSDRPLYVLVWGGLDDLAQALHDAPDIVPDIRVHWIGGPNKKWSVNSYVYIVSNFPELWFIEDNASYRGFICEPKNTGKYHWGYYDTFIKGAGPLADDFAAYYRGNPKLGDTPSLLYMMDGDPADPTRESWGGSYEPFHRSARVVFNGTTTAHDTAPVYGIMEFHIKGPKLKHVKTGTPCITLTVDKQTWDGYYMGQGNYMVRYSTYKTGVIPYTITSDVVEDFKPLHGEICVDNLFPGKPNKTDYTLGDNYYTDKQDATLFFKDCQGALTVQKWRDEVMEDWGKRWSWLKGNE